MDGKLISVNDTILAFSERVAVDGTKGAILYFGKDKITKYYIAEACFTGTEMEKTKTLKVGDVISFEGKR